MRWSTIAVAMLLTILADLALAADGKTLLMLSQSPDSHPPGTHEYAKGIETLAQVLRPTDGLTIRVAKADDPWPEGPGLINEADGVVMFLSEGAHWLQNDALLHEAFTRLAARGGGLVAIHWAIGTKAAEPIEPFLRLFGGCHGGQDRKYQVVETELRIADPSHPIASGMKSFRARDEFYYRLKFVQATPPIRSVLEATIDGRVETVAWSWQRPDGGRSFGFSGLHFHENWNLLEYRRLLSNAVLWTLATRTE